MESILTPLISQLKNPWQYVCVGVAWGYIIYFDINREYLAPATLCAMGIAYFLSQLTNFIFDKIMLRKWKKEILFNLIHMNAEEKKFVWRCFSTNTQTSTINIIYKKTSIWKTLPQKGIACIPNNSDEMTDLPLTITSPVWEVIEKNTDEIFKDYENAE